MDERGEMQQLDGRAHEYRLVGCAAQHPGNEQCDRWAHTLALNGDQGFQQTLDGRFAGGSHLLQAGFNPAKFLCDGRVETQGRFHLYIHLTYRAVCASSIAVSRSTVPSSSLVKSGVGVGSACPAGGGVTDHPLSTRGALKPMRAWRRSLAWGMKG